MATPKKNTVPDVEYLEIDGQKYELKPLKVAPLRRFMRRFGDMKNADLEDPTSLMDVLFDCSAIAMHREFPSETAYVTKIFAGEADTITDEDREAWGDLVDMDDVAKINKFRGGVAFDSPNPEAEETTQTPPEANQN